MLHGDRVVGCPPIHQVKATDCAGEEVELDAAFEACGSATRGVATATPDRCQGVRKLNARAIVNPNAGEALEDGNGNRIGGNNVLDTREEHIVKQRRGGISEALVNRLRRDIHAQSASHLGELLDGGRRMGKPAVHQRLHQGAGGEFCPVRTLNIAEFDRQVLGCGRQERLHGLTALWYGRHGAGPRHNGESPIYHATEPAPFFTVG